MNLDLINYDEFKKTELTQAQTDYFERHSVLHDLGIISQDVHEFYVRLKTVMINSAGRSFISYPNEFDLDISDLPDCTMIPETGQLGGERIRVFVNHKEGFDSLCEVGSCDLNDNI